MFRKLLQTLTYFRGHHSTSCYAKSHSNSWPSNCFRLLYKMATTDYSSLARPRPVIGVCQMTCTADKQANFLSAKSLVERCKCMGAQMVSLTEAYDYSQTWIKRPLRGKTKSGLLIQMVFLPEACDYIAESKQQSMEMAESLQGETISKYRQLARDLSLWISVGGFHQKSPDPSCNKLYNTHVILDGKGEVRGTYCKAHMFDLDIPGKIRLCESDYTIPGVSIAAPVDTPIGKVGLGICYDMRFPEMSLGLRNLGTQLLTYPSAFTVPTGMAHWQVLLRNRAIETQCYVVAAAQTGKHNEKRSSYGHSMVVDPWGTVVAECPEGPGVCVAEVDLLYLDKVRSQMPVLDHHRHDLYGHITLTAKVAIDSVSEYEFGQYKIGCSQVFYRTRLSYAFVNIKPVLPGHVLVASLRNAPRLADLDTSEIADLFNTVKVVSTVIEKHFKGKSITLAVQDGADAGQTVKHVHVHILPRRDGDFSQNDTVYQELEDHDKDLEKNRREGKLRTEEQMNCEAAQLRTYFI